MITEGSATKFTLVLLDYGFITGVEVASPCHHEFWGCSGPFLSPSTRSDPALWSQQSKAWLWTTEDIKPVDAQWVKLENHSHNDAEGVDSGHFSSSLPSPSSSFRSSLYFDSFSSCLIWCVYGQSVLRMVYNGTNCAEMSCMRNLCKAPAMLLPESI